MIRWIDMLCYCFSHYSLNSIVRFSIIRRAGKDESHLTFSFVSASFSVLLATSTFHAEDKWITNVHARKLKAVEPTICYRCLGDMLSLATISDTDTRHRRTVKGDKLLNNETTWMHFYTERKRNSNSIGNGANERQPNRRWTLNTLKKK